MKSNANPAARPTHSISRLTWMLVAASLVLASCSGARQARSEADSESFASSGRHSAGLIAAQLLPDSSRFQTLSFDWVDASRNREVPARLYLPAAAASSVNAGTQGPAAAAVRLGSQERIPLVVFSHGLGGSRDGYSYLGKYWAAAGIASLHVQHIGSDRKLWSGTVLTMASRLKEAAADSEAIARTQDVRFALDQVLANPDLPLDANRIAVAGHSYGANTSLLLARARVVRNGQTMDFRDPRIKAAIVISAPPFYGETDVASILAPIQIPMLHISSTGDEIKVPGYGSKAEDRVALFNALPKREGTQMVLFKDGSHSMFTDRLRTGGDELNPAVKRATQDLSLAFLQQQLQAGSKAEGGTLATLLPNYQSLIDRVIR